MAMPATNTVLMNIVPNFWSFGNNPTGTMLRTRITLGAFFLVNANHGLLLILEEKVLQVWFFSVMMQCNRKNLL